MADAARDYIEAMVQAVVGVETGIDRLVGKFKPSQHKEVGDWLGAVMALGNSDRGEARSYGSSYASKGRELSALAGTGPMHGVEKQCLQLVLCLIGFIARPQQGDPQCAH
ncbi:hypothetical protein D3C77_383550 [compost metagenome]